MNQLYKGVVVVTLSEVVGLLYFVKYKMILNE